MTGMSSVGEEKQLRVIIAGIGGFGAAHHEVFSALEERGECRVIATCDPAASELAAICESQRFAERGIEIYSSFDAMMDARATSADLAVISTPIQWHAHMHQACVSAGIACYLEKPPTLDPEEFERMISFEENSRRETHVGFGFIHLADRLALKERMVSGEFGRLQRVSFLGLARRAPSYFARNTWAGRLLLGGNLLLDSCCGNALSHYVNNMLFFAGQGGLREWSRPIEIETELYRANEIEGPDSVFAAGVLENGVKFRLAISHACPNAEPVLQEEMTFEHATVEIKSNTAVEIRRAGKESERFGIEDQSLSTNVAAYLEYMNGLQARPAIRLEDCRGFIELNGLLYLAAGRIHLVSQPGRLQSGDEAIVIPHVDEAAERLISGGIFPSQAGYPWGQGGGKAAIEDLPKLLPAVRALMN